jgi:iron complex outermembrane receptor protein
LRVGGVRLTPTAGITNLLGARYNASVVVNAFGRRFYEPGPGRALYTGVSVALGGSR